MDFNISDDTNVGASVVDVVGLPDSLVELVAFVGVFCFWHTVDMDKVDVDIASTDV